MTFSLECKSECECSRVIGGHSDGERFSPKGKLSTAFGPSTTETRNICNMPELVHESLPTKIVCSRLAKTSFRCRPSDLRTGFAGILLTATLMVMVATEARSLAAPDPTAAASRPAITVIDPLESGFFAKRLDYEGIAIKAPTNVVDEALFAAYGRLSMMLSNLPSVRVKLRSAGAELHIIGRDQVTTDLPEWRHDKGKRLDEYHGLTRDERTRGMGGLLTSCGEENLLRLENDHYRGRDICVHEFAHNILGQGASRTVREKVREQLRRSLDGGLWVGSYGGSNHDEFFAELSMWYFGTHGDLGMKGSKPGNGRAGLKAYDPEAFTLLDDFYSGRMEPAAAPKDIQSQTKSQLSP